MYRFHRAAQAKSGKLLEAIQFARQISAYLNDRYAPLSVQAYSEVFGSTNMIHL